MAGQSTRRPAAPKWSPTEGPGTFPADHPRPARPRRRAVRRPPCRCDPVAWRNTSATIVSGREQAERARDHEHETWLRNHKAEVYAKFVDSAVALLLWCKRTERGKEREDKITEMVFAVRPTLLRLVAPDDIMKLADAIYGQCMRATGAIFPHDHDEYFDKRFAEIHDDLANFSALCRTDLHSPTGSSATS